MPSFRATVETVGLAIDGVLVLGLIVLIRTFLSVALQVEIEGRWPWRGDRSQA